MEENDLITITADNNGYLAIVYGIMVLFFAFIGALSHAKKKQSVFAGVFLGFVAATMIMFIIMTIMALNINYGWI